MRRQEVLTICDNEEVDAKDSKAFSNLVIAVLELSLHDSGIDFDYNDTTQTSKDHPGNKCQKVHPARERTGLAFDGPIGRSGTWW